MTRIYFVLMLALSILLPRSADAQSFPEGFRYQAVIRDNAGNLIANQTVQVRTGILLTSMSGTLVYEEDHTLLTDMYGHVSLVVGEGTSTGNGQSNDFSTIVWGASETYLNVQLDETNTGSFIDIMTTRLYAVPYAFHAKTTAQEFSIAELTDVDTTGVQTGETLSWNGSMWVPAGLADSVAYAVTAGSATYSDTANFAWNAQNIIPSDTANFAYFSDTANFASTALTSTYADTANYADSADFAWNCFDNWSMQGNTLAGGEYLGTNSADDLVIKTNNVERMRITSAGLIGVGTQTPIADMHIVGDEGFLFKSTLGQGSPQVFSGNRMVWYPNKAHFYVGDGSFGAIGNYSFGVGLSCIPDGDYSFALGYQSRASGDYSMAGGYSSWARANYSIAWGYDSEVSTTGEGGIAFGRDARVWYNYGIALGYHPHSTAAYGIAIGFQPRAGGEHAVALGYRSRSDHDGSFVWADSSTPSFTYSTAHNQFTVRASGGAYFYSSANLTSGVELLPGAGAWSTVSDRRKKENFEAVDGELVLSKLDDMEVTSWNYKAQNDEIRHIGPMAQDFYGAFGYGESDTTITTTDIDGVNMAALKALIIRTEQLQVEADQLSDAKAKVEALTEERDALVLRIENMEAMIMRLMEATAVKSDAEMVGSRSK